MEKNKQSRRNFLRNSAVGASVFGLDFSMPNWLFSTNTEGVFGSSLAVAPTVTFIRESLALTQTLVDSIIAKQSNVTSLVLVANTITLSENIKIKRDLQLTLIADNINGAGKTIDMSQPQNPNATVAGYTPKNVYLHAKKIVGLTINAVGTQGSNGVNSTVHFKKTADGTQFGIPDKFVAPGNGQNGANGGNGGNVYIFFVESNNTVINSAAGKGGVGGTGGTGGKYCAEYDKANPRKSKKTVGSSWVWVFSYDCLREERIYGQSGNPGLNGKDGIKDVKKQTTTDWYKTTHVKSPNWSAYRARLADYYYRTVNDPTPHPDPALKDGFLRNRHAVRQVLAALALNPANLAAKQLKTRIYYGHSPIGFSWNIDVNPQVGEFQTAYTQFYPMVDSIHTHAKNYLTNALTADGFKLALEAESGHLIAFANNHDILIQQKIMPEIIKKQGEITTRVQKDTRLSGDIENRKQAIANQPFSFGDFVTTVGAVVGVVSAIYTGGTSLIGAFNGFATVIEGGVGFFDTLDTLGSFRDIGIEIGEFKNLTKGDKTLSEAPLANNAFTVKEAAQNFNADRKKIEIAGKKLVFNIEQMANSIKNIDTGDKELNRLMNEKAENMLQVATLKKDLAYLDLDRKVAEAQKEEFQKAATQINKALAQINPQTMLKEFSFMLSRATHYMNILTKLVFFTARSLEILQFKDLSSTVRFDIGHPHPDLFENMNYFEDKASAEVLSIAFNRSWAEFAATIRFKEEYLNFTVLQNWTMHTIRKSFKGDAINHLKTNPSAALLFDIKTDNPTLLDKKFALIQSIKVAYIGAKMTNFKAFNAKLYQSGHLQQRVFDNSIKKAILEGRTDNIPDANTTALPESISFPTLAMKDRAVFSSYELSVPSAEVQQQGIDFSNLTEVQVAIQVKYTNSAGNFRRG
jgi:chorismate mutase